MKKSRPKEGDIILVSVKSSHDQSIKLRPAVCLREMPPNYQEFLVCGLTTDISLYLESFDEKVTPQDDSLKNLRGESVIRLGFLDRVQTRTVPGSIGSISVKRHKRLLQRLSNYLVDGL